MFETRYPFKLLYKPHPRFAVDPGNAALLVLDAQRLTMDTEGAFARLARLKGVEAEFKYYYASLKEATPKMAELLTGCREAGTRVMFTRIAPVDMDPEGFMSRLDGVDSREEDAEILEALTPVAGEAVIDRQCENPFNCAGFVEALNKMNPRFLILCGVRTPGTLNRVALDAADRGIGVIVASDASAGGVPRGLINLPGGMIKVRKTGAILQMLSEPVTGGAGQ